MGLFHKFDTGNDYCKKKKKFQTIEVWLYFSPYNYSIVFREITGDQIAFKIKGNYRNLWNYSKFIIQNLYNISVSKLLN